MRKHILVYLILLSSISYAQNTPQNGISKLKNKTTAKVTVNSNIGVAEFVKFPVNKALSLQGITLQQKSISFLETYKTIFNIKAINTLAFKKEKMDNYGFKQVIFNQTYKNVPVYAGNLRFYFNRQNKLTATNGNYFPSIKLNPTPSISLANIKNIALTAIKNQNINYSGETLKVNKSTLYVFPKGFVQGHLESYHLAYEIEVSNDLDVREFIFVDAHSGKILEQFTGIAHAIDRRLYETNTSNLTWQEGDAFPSVLDQWQQNEIMASEHTYNFFKNAFGYTSYDGFDTQMRIVNNAGLSCPNASWNGSTVNFCFEVASDDVIGHEWAHAYTQFTSGLIYAFQPGAINEAYSDIWGETIDILNNYEDLDDDHSLRTSCSNSDRWKMGEDATGFGNPIRDMWDPTCNFDPGKVTDGLFRCGDSDNGGVHTNSGVPNHTYALLVDGGLYNGQTINAIGFTKTAHIFWRAQTTYLTPTSDFAVLADALESACSDLIGINLEGLSTTTIPAGLSGEIITTADCAEVAKAILAVEMRTDPIACGYVPILQATPPLCDAAISNPLFYEDWESGLGGWTVTQIPTNPITWTSRDWVVESSLPDGRLGNGIFGVDPINGNCSTILENGIIRLESPIITVPSTITGNYEMAFNHYISTETDWDGGNIKYSINGGTWMLLPNDAFTANPYNNVLNTLAAGNDNPMQGEEAFSGSDGGSVSGSWGQSVVDLSFIGIAANDDIQFRWELGTDGCNGRIGWYLDEISVYDCSRLSVTNFDSIKTGIKIFPNPSGGIFTLIKISDVDLIDAKIYDISGRFIKQINLSSFKFEKQIDLSRFPAGLYFMSVTASDTKSVIKLIKQGIY